ncbi:hypothetical protein BLNAU_24708 [Blattamonas nauphoetae]|uniref:Uncharacterized protein n=1 Tax=Blattamonas nauphoetae TaxID=2049346 RepID=A0ABQ9WM30_9EUKA|nr:hypothetical protein BLNAU_24708 [Blattamonas nauphoetae]
MPNSSPPSHGSDTRKRFKGICGGYSDHHCPKCFRAAQTSLEVTRWTLWDCTLGHLEDFARSNFFSLRPLSFQEDPKQLKQNNYDGYPHQSHRTLNAGQYQQKGLSSTEREVCTN